MRRFFSLLLFLAVVGSWTLTPWAAAALSPGEILVLTVNPPTFAPGEVMTVDPASGDRAIFSLSDLTAVACSASGGFHPCCTGGGTGDGTGHCTDHGVGPALPSFTRDLELARDGAIYAAGANPGGGLYRIDPATGDRSLVSRETSSFIAVTRTGQIFANSGGIKRIDPVSGTSFVVPAPPETLEKLADIDPAPGGLLLTAGDTITLLDPNTGNATIVSTPDRTQFCSSAGVPFTCCTGNDTGTTEPPCTEVGSGPAPRLFLGFPAPGPFEHVSLTPDGTILASNFGDSEVFLIDADTGDRTLIADSSDENGPTFTVHSLLAESNSSALLLGSSLVRLDLDTGTRSIVSGMGVGSGPLLRGVNVPGGGLAIFEGIPHVPALPPLVHVVAALVLIGAAALAWARQR